MTNTRIRSILIIVIAALLVSVLFNIRTFIYYFEALAKLGEGQTEKGDLLGVRFKFSYFNLIIEFIVFILVAFFNYACLPVYPPQEGRQGVISWNTVN